MSQFYIASNTPSTSSTPAYTASASDDDDDDEQDTLPYPAELSRKDFLTPDFDPQTYLSSLRNRHQTLEDLRSDLRQRSQLLNRELLDLVNGNYEEFLSLGGDLRGGEEKVEGVRVGLLGFQREVASIRKAVRERVTETGDLLAERKGLRRDIVLGRQLLEVNERVEELEEELGITIREGGEDDEDDVVGEEETAEEREVARLKGRVVQYLVITKTVERVGPEHPFLLSLRPRLEVARKTVLLDLCAALRHAKVARDKGTILSLSSIFGELDAQKDALKVLKGG